MGFYEMLFYAISNGVEFQFTEVGISIILISKEKKSRENLFDGTIMAETIFYRGKRGDFR